jgi:GNAT superfamily N-acetyltransferase
MPALEHIRPATAADFPLFAHFYAQLAEEGQAPLDEAWWAKSYGDALFLFDGDRAIAFALAYVLEGEGHVSQVVVDASARGRGAGRIIMRAVAARLRERGCTQWSLHVTHGNHAALALYARCGLRAVHDTDRLVVPWSAVEKLPRTEAVEVTAAGPADDAALERVIAMPVGFLKRVRRFPGRAYYLAHRPNSAAPIGGIVLYPPPDSAAILQAEDAASARALLDASRRTAGDADEVILYVTENAALRDALVAIGGRVMAVTRFMRGNLRDA